MSTAGLTATLASLHAAGVRWTLTGGGIPVPGVRPGRTLTDATRAQLATLRPYRPQLATLARTGRCPGCGVHALPPLMVCYWCQRGRS
ncbi:MAG: hypothetical protein MUF00_18055 [Gemmatimonadaceae bacterium]|jgi:hypothetical protein|nr:hypothetical protein [Gemmatimonadaceae bacterium]